MKFKAKKDEIAPWQTYEQKTFTSAFISPVVKMKNQQKEKVDLAQSHLKPKKTERKRLTTLESIIRLKTLNQRTQIQHFSPLRKNSPKKVQELVPLNRNLINIINNVHQNNNKLNPQICNLKHRPSMKKIQKDASNNIKTERNKFTIDNKITLQKRRQEIQNLKRFLFNKINPSLETLLKAKQHLSHINKVHAQPILRSYSIHNILLNNIEQKDINDVICTDRKDMKKLKFGFNLTGQNFRPKSDMKNQVKKRTNSSVNKKQNLHIIDRLYDRFQ